MLPREHHALQHLRHEKSIRQQYPTIFDTLFGPKTGVLSLYSPNPCSDRLHEVAALPFLRVKPVAPCWSSGLLAFPHSLVHTSLVTADGSFYIP